MCIVKNASFIHLFKSILFLNQLAIPLMVLALAYVYLRWEKLNFSINYIIAGVLGVLYLIEMYYIKCKIVFDSSYGYLVNIKNETPFYLCSLIIMGMLLVFCVYFIDKPHNNRWGIIYLIIALVFVIIESILYLGGLRLFPYPILGDAIFIFIMNLAVNTFKKTSR